MFCKNCGNQIADDAIFCSHCGTRVAEAVAAVPVQQVMEAAADTDAQKIQYTEPDSQQAEPVVPAKPFLEGMSWDVSEYPDSNIVEKTEDINFDWGLDPDEIRQAGVPTPVVEDVAPEPAPIPKSSSAPDPAGEVFDRVVPAEEAKASISVRESLEAANKIESVGQFDTFNKKNAQFQELLDREYEKVRGAGTIGSEQMEAEEVASRKFDSRREDMTMDEFLQREGAVKLYEPEDVRSDVLDRIAAQDRQRAQKEAEEEARIKALEEAREEAAAKKAAEDAARLEAIARRQAEEEARVQEELRRRAADEARARAEEEARKKEEEIARARAEEAARAQAEEAARLRAEADLKAAQEAARFRAQQEAASAAREEAEFKAAQERRKREEEIARLKREAEEKQRARAEDSALVEDEVRKALEQTAKMRQEEEDKIKAALAGIRGGRFSDTISSTQRMDEPVSAETPVPTPEPAPVQEAVPRTTIETPQTLEAVDVAPQATDRGTIFAAKDEIEAAHRHTRYNIEGMAKAREDFFADLPGGDPQSDRDAEAEARRSRDDLVSPLTRTVDKEAIAAGLSSTKKLSREDMQVSAGDLLNQFASVATEPVVPAATETVAPAAGAVPAAPAAAPAPEVPTVEAAPTPIETPAEAPIATPVATTAEVQIDAQAAAPKEMQPEPVVEDISLETPDDGMIELEDVAPQATDDPSLAALMADKPGLEDTMVMPEVTRIDELTTRQIDGYKDADPEELKRLRQAAAIQEARAQEEAAAAAAELGAARERSLEPTHETSRQIAEDMATRVAQTPAPTGGTVDEADMIADEPILTSKELRKRERAEAREARKLAKKKKKEEKQREIEDTFGDEEAVGIVEDVAEEEKQGGKGRVILMIILIFLCLIFAAELAGIVIKTVASTSAAAEFIDNILNSLIHMITDEPDGGAGTV